VADEQDQYQPEEIQEPPLPEGASSADDLSADQEELRQIIAGIPGPDEDADSDIRRGVTGGDGAIVSDDSTGAVVMGEEPEAPQPVVADNPILLGVPKEAYSAGDTVDLDPCDASGTKTSGASAVTVQAGWTLPEDATIPTTQIIPYQLAADGKYYAIGQAKTVIRDVRYDLTTFTLQKKWFLDFGAFSSTESDWETMENGDTVEYTEPEP
jgi:hypothetical protein